MPFCPTYPLWVTGIFSVPLKSPDGDSIHFISETPLPPHLKTHLDGSISLRLIATDAPETHYAPRGTGISLKQPTQWPLNATKALLQFCGYSDIILNSNQRIVECPTPPQQGFALLLQQDKYGRVLAWVFRGECPFTRTPPQNLPASWIEHSANGQLLKKGFVYPYFSEAINSEQINTCQEFVANAQKKSLGIWSEDRSQRFDFTDPQSLTQSQLIWPFLFRRLMTWLTQSTPRPTWLEFSQEHIDWVRLKHLPQWIPLNNLLAISEGQMSLLVPTQDIIFKAILPNRPGVPSR